MLLDFFEFGPVMPCRIVGGCTCDDMAYKDKYGIACKHILRVGRWLTTDRMTSCRHTYQHYYGKVML